MTVTYTVGDTREVIATIPDGSVDLIASSPPFLALRSYVPADHESKGDEIGSERNPAEFIDMLLGLTAEWGRVLAPHGSIAIELGDTYSGSGGAGGDYNEGGLRDGQGKFDGSQARTRPRTDGGQYGYWPNGGEKYNADERPIQGKGGWPRAKSLALIPQLYAIALAYGINPLTGQPSPAGRWLVRNVIVWHRPNPAVGALGDKVRPSTSYIVVATRSPKRWFDLTAVRHDLINPSHDKSRSAGIPRPLPPGSKSTTNRGMTAGVAPVSAGAPPLDAWFDEYDSNLAKITVVDEYSKVWHDTWTLTTQPSRLAHYAMWPAKLAERLILSMCPREVCRICGEPRRRIEESTLVMLSGTRGQKADHLGNTTTMQRSESRPTTLGWTDCGHDDYRPGLVLDPFAGSGTTLAVADLHGRDAIGIDFDARNKAIYPARYDEVKRALFGTPAPMPGQGDLFAEEVPARRDPRVYGPGDPADEYADPARPA